MQVYLLLTESCNLRCTYCIRGKKKNDFLDISALKKVLKENDFRQEQVLLTGGEPLMHPYFSEILELCLDSFKYVSINTNGLLFDTCKIKVNPRLHIQVSLDGPNKVHEKIRGIETYSKVLDTITEIDRLGYSYNIASVINKTNYNEIKLLIPVLYELKGMKYWKVEPELPFGCGTWDDCVSVEQWNLLVNELINSCPFRLRVKKLFDFSVLDSLTEEKLEALRGRKFSNCGSCSNKIYIYPDLTVYPCTCLTDFPIGNLMKNSYKDIIDSREASLFKNYTLDKESNCYRCKYVKFCNGGCIGCSYHYFGKIGMGDGRCPMNH